MKYILKEKTPIPCEDEDLWKAWFKPENFEMATYDTQSHLIKLLFIGNPMIFPNSDEINFFKVTVNLKSVVVQSTFYPTWKEALAKYDDLILSYIKTLH